MADSGSTEPAKVQTRVAVTRKHMKREQITSRKTKVVATDTIKERQVTI